MLAHFRANVSAILCAGNQAIQPANFRKDQSDTWLKRNNALWSAGSHRPILAFPQAVLSTTPPSGEEDCFKIVVSRFEIGGYCSACRGTQ
jgi:hypothetical protein